MEPAQKNSQGSRPALAQAAKDHRGHPLLRSLEAYLEDEIGKHHRAIVKCDDPMEVYRLQGRVTQLQSMESAIKEPK